MSRNIAFRSTLALLVVAAAAHTASAGPKVFFDRDDTTAGMTSFPNSQAAFDEFTSKLGSYGTDGFESTIFFDLAPVLSFGATGITATTQGIAALNSPGYQIGDYAAPEYDAAIDPSTAIDTAFYFSEPITAVGLFVVQAGDMANHQEVTFRLDGPNGPKDVVVEVGPGWGDENTFFIGIGTKQSFTSLTILEPTDLADGMVYDHITAGVFVPEPSSLALVTIGAASALGLAVRRRLQKS